ncbi:MAG TPA: tetratricopeptide repeat protein [Verrucomicrobiae bacterium]
MLFGIYFVLKDENPIQFYPAFGKKRCTLTFIQKSLQVLALLAVAAVAGCASNVSESRVVVASASINGHPARMFLDTGASSTVLFDSGAKRLGLKPGEISEPVPITIDGQTFTAPLPIFKPQVQWYYRLAFAKSEGSLEGLVGWPEIRDNILVFDADNRVIRSVEQLPPETAGWLKLKVIPDSWLLLEVPLAHRRTGIVEVDTGSPFAFQMPPRQWKEWTTMHPGVPVSSHWGGVASFGVGRYRTAWADEFRLGPMTLTDVPVQDMMNSEVAFLQGKKPTADALWVIGLYGLTRMDLIVDGKNGWAYVHPRSGTGLPYSGVKRPGYTNSIPNARDGGGNWSVADNVRLSSESLYAGSAEYKWSKDDLTGALADYTRVIEINPRNGDAWSARAYIKTSQGDALGSIFDCTRALEIDPNNYDAYFRRGVARQIRGDYSGAISDYDQVLRLKPDDADYPRLYRQTLLIALGRATADSSRNAASWKGRWTKDISQFLAGRINEKSFLAAARKSDAEPASGQKCEAHYYIGMMRLVGGDKAGARDAFQKSRIIQLKDYDEYQFSGAELSRLTTVAQQSSK